MIGLFCQLNHHCMQRKPENHSLERSWNNHFSHKKSPNSHYLLQESQVCLLFVCQVQLCEWQTCLSKRHSGFKDAPLWPVQSYQPWYWSYWADQETATWHKSTSEAVFCFVPSVTCNIHCFLHMFGVNVKHIKQSHLHCKASVCHDLRYRNSVEFT